MLSTRHVCQILIKFEFFSTYFRKILQTSRKSARWGRAVLRGRTDTTNLTAALRNFANAPKKHEVKRRLKVTKGRQEENVRLTATGPQLAQQAASVCGVQSRLTATQQSLHYSHSPTTSLSLISVNLAHKCHRPMTFK